MTDDQMNLLEVDDAFAELFEKRPMELGGLNILKLTYPDDRGLNRQYLDQARRDGRSFAITKRYLIDGRTIWVRNHVRHIAEGLGGPRFMATVEPLEAVERETPMAAAVRSGENMLRRRRMRSQFFDAATAKDAKFDLMIDMFVSEGHGRRLSVSGACLTPGRGATTNLRHLLDLEKLGAVVRVSDPDDKRRYFTQLSEEYRERIRLYLNACDST